MEVPQTQPHKRVQVFPELVSGLFGALNGPGGEDAGACLRDLLPYNVRLLREEELPLEPVDETLRKQVEQLEREVERLGAQVETEREQLQPTMRKRVHEAMRIALEDMDGNAADGGETKAVGGALSEALVREAKRSVSGVSAERVLQLHADVDTTCALAVRVRDALDQLNDGSSTPEADTTMTIMLDDTPHASRRSARVDSFMSPEAFRLADSPLPFMSPNVTPRSRTRRKMSAQRRLQMPR